MKKPRVYSGGLVITRKEGQSIWLKVAGLEIRIDVRSMRSNQVSLGILADPKLVDVDRRDDLEEAPASSLKR